MVQVNLSFKLNKIERNAIKTGIRLLCFSFTIKYGQTTTGLFHINEIISDKIRCNLTQS